MVLTIIYFTPLIFLLFNVVIYILFLRDRGFDWHGPSFKNVDMALLALSHMHGVPDKYQDEYGVDETKLVYTGKIQE